MNQGGKSIFAKLLINFFDPTEVSTTFEGGGQESFHHTLCQLITDKSRSHTQYVCIIMLPRKSC